MKLSNVLVLLPMAILLAFAVACGGGVKHKADYTWPFSTGTISFSEVECCERKTGVLGKQWLGSGIVENAQREEPFGCSLQLNSVAKMGLF